ncbi:VCBS repeat-containing protein [Candidatus Reidiella endopervernicosa]|uniref:VCBS repeat-containing protein n=1 Tax=Candidatus Reidiella endopervernicosa TaxID=2738883 RepID=A0A6N0HX65_9GAMM|nr:VCBS repeat-containing protein [Candidatus Reidiella endopervernicosa]QKQ26891.1 VCBS repeat-containing protein [Candidatus Reidiella endopervernicosa]
MAIEQLPSAQQAVQRRPAPPVSASPPGKPESERERLPVPGNPRALENRPDVACGRIPVAIPPLPTALPAQAPATFTAESNPDALPAEGEVQLDENYRFYANFLRQILDLNEGAGEFESFDLSAETQIFESTDITIFAADSVIEIEYVRFEAVSIDIEMSEDRLSVSINRTEFEQFSLRQSSNIEQPVRRADPLALDLDGNGIQTTGIENGVNFDINADGILDRTSFITGNDAMLAFDRNGNGHIDDGRELFGDQNGHENGFMALADYDKNGDGRIDRKDEIYSKLKLLQIDSSGQQSQRSLFEAGVSVSR